MIQRARRSDWISLCCVLGHVSLVFGPLFLTPLMSRWWWILVWAWVGVGCSGILNICHEASHGLVFSHARWSLWLGDYFLGPLLCSDFKSYQERHQAHHRHFGSLPNDPKYTYRISIKGRKIFQFYFRCFSFREAVFKFLHQFSESPSTAMGSRSLWILHLFPVHALMLSGLVTSHVLFGEGSGASLWLDVFAVYFLVYLSALMTWTVFISTLRSIAEHQPFEGEVPHHGAAVLRNFSTSAFTWFAFGSWGLQFHSSHHRWPYVPYYQLSSLTQLQAREDFKLGVQNSYLVTLFRAVGFQFFNSAIDRGFPVFPGIPLRVFFRERLTRRSRQKM